ncbi:hypothetical protein GDO81_004696 [Engystomops pustulosus]|uniref:Uncharacterized protein n=1 Tax=Engystomops pustulosus TaxID=76066 RepID=A0AAV7CHV5_ENGPU|nr:hypothetical protein GDO81_004696 [Engystomops pustulosus]
MNGDSSWGLVTLFIHNPLIIFEALFTDPSHFLWLPLSFCICEQQEIFFSHIRVHRSPGSRGLSAGFNIGAHWHCCRGKLQM